MLRYFNIHYLSDNDLKLLQRGLYELQYSKLIDYGGNFVEVIKHEKAIRSARSHGLYEEFQRLKETCKETYIVMPPAGDLTPRNTYPQNYVWGDLSKEMRDYIKYQDVVCYERQYAEIKHGVPLEQYDRRLDRYYKYYGLDGTDELFERHVLLGHPVPTAGYKKAMDSARRAYKTINGLVKANISDLGYFVTLTFAPKQNMDKHKKLDLDFDYIDGADFLDVKQAFTAWMHNLQRRQKDKGESVKYICVWEQTKRNNYHFHLICNKLPDSEFKENPAILQYDTIERKYDKSVGLRSWTHGKSDYQRVTSEEKMTTYLSKYILKSVYNLADDEDELEKYKGKRKYFISKNLKKPIETYEDAEIEEYNDLYENQTINPYNEGKITRRIYTLIGNKKDAPSPERPIEKTNN